MAPVIWILAAAAVIFVIELATGRHKGVHHRQDYMIIGATLLGSQFTKPLIALVTAGLFGLMLPAYKGALADISFWLIFPPMFLVGEFMQYWVHRWAHDSNRHKLLYGMHRTHHSAPYVNVTLLYRSNLAWAFIHPYTWLVALAFYFGQVAAGTAFYLTIMLWNALTHSDWRWDDWIIQHFSWGRTFIEAIEWVFITPRIHHTHHGFGKDGKAYRNFNTMLSINDRIFGTLHIPDGRPMYYGLPGGEHHWFRQMLFPLVPLGKPVRYRAPRRTADVEAQRRQVRTGGK